MLTNANIDLTKQIFLKDYSIFIRNSKLEDLLATYLANINSSGNSLIGFFSHISARELEVRARQGLVKLLAGIENGSATDEVKKTLEHWKQEGLPGIPREVLSLKDITLLYSAQKLSFQSFIPQYTTDVSIACKIIFEIELYYKQVQEFTLEMYESIQREEQEKRRESENKYHDLFNNAGDLIQVVGPDNTILYVNNSWLKTLGYLREDAVGKSILDFIVANERDNYNNNCSENLNGQKLTAYVRTNYLKKDGEIVTLEGSVNCKFKDNELEYTQAIFHDISQKLEQEKKINFYINQLSEREENLKVIVESAPDGIIVIDKESKILLWNPVAETILGWKKEEALGKVMFEIIMPHRYHEVHNAGMKRYILTKEAQILNKTIEVPAVHKEGRELFMSLTVSHSIQAGRDIFIAFVRDINEQKKNEIELENKRIQLERSNKELQQYAWLTSHDLKEPLRKILTFSDVLIKKYQENIPENAFVYLNKIYSAAGRMNSLIEAVLSYSNVANDESLFKKTDLNIVLHEVLDDLELMISSKRAIIHYSVLPVIKAIPIQMRQLFQNVISNSIKYSKTGEIPEVHITCTRENDGFTFIFKDNGIGFEEIYAGKIFEVFQRLQNNKAYEGTGIGLALCKKITEAHKGTISAESKVGVGSVFTVCLPDLA